MHNLLSINTLLTVLLSLLYIYSINVQIIAICIIVIIILNIFLILKVRILKQPKIYKDTSKHLSKPIKENVNLEDIFKKYNALPTISIELPNFTEILISNNVKLDDEKSLTEKANAVINELKRSKINLSLENIIRSSKINQLRFKLSDYIDQNGKVEIADVKKFSAKSAIIKNKLKTNNVEVLELIEGTDLVGLELKSSFAEENKLSLKQLLLSQEFQSYDKNFTLPICYGERLTGQPYIIDIQTAVHGSITGATGSGKSVALNIIINNLLLNYAPTDLELYLSDVKLVEFSAYKNLAHLGMPIANTAESTANIITHLLEEMDNRYKILEKAGVKNINAYNKKQKNKLKRIVLIIDEIADVFASETHGQLVTTQLTRLLMLGRASGIHCLYGTQRMDKGTIPMDIRSNTPLKICLKVSNITESMIVLNSAGAEQLIGSGDSLISANGKIERVQAAYISDEEIDKICNFWNKNKEETDETQNA